MANVAKKTQKTKIVFWFLPKKTPYEPDLSLLNQPNRRTGQKSRPAKTSFLLRETPPPPRTAALRTGKAERTEGRPPHGGRPSETKACEKDLQNYHVRIASSNHSVRRVRKSLAYCTSFSHVPSVMTSTATGVLMMFHFLKFSFCDSEILCAVSLI